MKRRFVRVCALGVLGLSIVSACKAVEELQNHVSAVQFEMRSYKLDVAGGAFVSRAASPTKRQPKVIAYGGAIYALGGIDGSLRPVSTAEKYDPVANTWTTLAPWPSPRVTDEFFELSGQLCTLGGLLSSDGGGLSCYDPAKNTWAERAPIPSEAGTTAFRLGVATGKLYAFVGNSPKDNGDAGAFDATTYDDAGTDVGLPPGDLSPTAFFMYDPATDKWAQKTSAPFTCQGKPSVSSPGLDSMISIGTSLYVIGCAQKVATGGTALIDASLVYDTTTDRWSQIPPPAFYPVASFLVSGKIVSVTTVAPFVATFDPSTRIWTSSKALPPPFLPPREVGLLADATGVYYFDLVEATGTEAKDSVYIGGAWRYDLASDAWKKITTLARDVDASYVPQFAPVMLGNDPYLVGSWQSTVLSIH